MSRVWRVKCPAKICLSCLSCPGYIDNRRFVVPFINDKTAAYALNRHCPCSLADHIAGLPGAEHGCFQHFYFYKFPGLERIVKLGYEVFIYAAPSPPGIWRLRYWPANADMPSVYLSALSFPLSILIFIRLAKSEIAFPLCERPFFISSSISAYVRPFSGT